MKHIPCCQGGVDLILSLWPLESESRSVVSDSLWSHGLYSLWNSPGQNTGVGSLSLLQGNLPNPGIKPRSPSLQADSLLSEPPGKPYDKQSSQKSIYSTATSNTHTPHTTPHHTKLQQLAHGWTIFPSQSDQSLEILLNTEEVDTNHWNCWMCHWVKHRETSGQFCYHLGKKLPSY